jgi:hypothetical protein
MARYDVQVEDDAVTCTDDVKLFSADKRHQKTTPHHLPLPPLPPRPITSVDGDIKPTPHQPMSAGCSLSVEDSIAAYSPTYGVLVNGAPSPRSDTNGETSTHWLPALKSHFRSDLRAVVVMILGAFIFPFILLTGLFYERILVIQLILAIALYVLYVFLGIPYLRLNRNGAIVHLSLVSEEYSAYDEVSRHIGLLVQSHPVIRVKMAYKLSSTDVPCDSNQNTGTDTTSVVESGIDTDTRTSTNGAVVPKSNAVTSEVKKQFIDVPIESWTDDSDNTAEFIYNMPSDHRYFVKYNCIYELDTESKVWIDNLTQQVKEKLEAESAVCVSVRSRASLASSEKVRVIDNIRVLDSWRYTVSLLLVNRVTYWFSLITGTYILWILLWHLCIGQVNYHCVKKVRLSMYAEKSEIAV